MSHVDDGKLNALLDGELDSAEAAEVRSHIAGCAECARRLEEAKRFLAGADDLLGALELPASASAPAEPVRRVSKTAKEVAIDLDGATQKSPAIRSNLPEPAAPDRPARPRIDFATLAWAATIVLAIGVGYLANEVRHTRGGAVIGEESPGAGRSEARSPAPAQAPAPSARADRPAQLTASGTTAPGAARKTALPAGGKQLADQRRALQRAPAATPPGARAPAAPADATGGAGAAARAQERVPSHEAPAPAAAPAAARAGDRLAANNEPTLAVSGVAGPRGVAAGFHRTTLEEAVARLGGVIRLMDGMRFEQVEVGPGLLVPGADRTRDLVRLVYFDAAGRRLQLDQQRVTPTSGDAERLVSPDIGMHPGDTLTTAAPGGEVRVRWINGTFWLSLTGNLPPDSLRHLLARVR